MGYSDVLNDYFTSWIVWTNPKRMDIGYNLEGDVYCLTKLTKEDN